MRNDKIQIIIKLDVALDAVFNALQRIKQDLAGLMGDSFKGQTQLIQINSVQSGSVIMDAQLTIPQNQEPTTVYSTVNNKLLNAFKIGGFNLMQVSKVTLETDSIAPSPAP